MILIHMPNAEHASDVDLHLSLLIPLQINLLPALLMALEQDINSRCRLAGWTSHTGSTAEPSLAEKRLDLALPPPSPSPCSPTVTREQAIARATAEVGQLDAFAAALIPYIVVIRELRKLFPKNEQRGEESEYDDDHAERDQAPLRITREVVSALVEQPAVQAAEVIY